MSDHYHDENDLKLMREMRKLAPDDFNAWLGLEKTRRARQRRDSPKVSRIDRYRRVGDDPVSVLHGKPTPRRPMRPARPAKKLSKRRSSLRHCAPGRQQPMAPWRSSFSTSRRSRRRISSSVRVGANLKQQVLRLLAASVMTMPLFSCSGTRPTNLGVKDGRLSACPASPNCVSSDAADDAHGVAPFQLIVPPDDGWRAIRSAVEGLPRTKIISFTDDYHPRRVQQRGVWLCRRSRTALAAGGKADRRAFGLAPRSQRFRCEPKAGGRVAVGAA